MRLSPLRSAATTIAAFGIAAASAQAVTPPPLPASTSQVRVEPGLQKPEKQRSTRAHQHKWHKKDYTKDDSVPEPAPQPGKPKR